MLRMNFISKYALFSIIFIVGLLVYTNIVEIISYDINYYSKQEEETNTIVLLNDDNYDLNGKSKLKNQIQSQATGVNKLLVEYSKNDTTTMANKKKKIEELNLRQEAQEETVSSSQHIDARIIDTEYPSADSIYKILKDELQHVDESLKATEVKLRDFSNIYEMVYAFVAMFHRHHVPIVIGFGSHLGARRHHGIIPFGEKDIDFQVFGNAGQVLKIIEETLRTKQDWSSLKPIRSDFGYQLTTDELKSLGFSHYFYFWLFDDRYKGNLTICAGHSGTGCAKWYKHFHAKMPPVFNREDFFPLKYQVFGSHKVPIPSTSAELDTWQYSAETEHWNTTCGAHRVWDSKITRWKKVPKEERQCSFLYEKFPFVFKIADGREQLRQGSTVLHESSLTLRFLNEKH